MPFAHDGEWHEVTVTLPVTGVLNGIRIDPCNGPGAVAIDWIRVTREGAPVRAWEFGN